MAAVFAGPQMLAAYDSAVAAYLRWAGV
jgi:hypothetical protein